MAAETRLVSVGAGVTNDPDGVAIDWIVRLHSGRASAGDRQAFAAWRARDPGHENAALAAERLWAQIGEAGRPLLEGTGPGERRPTRRRLLQAGLGAAAAAGGLAWLPRYPRASFATTTGELATVALQPGVTAVLDARTGLRAEGEGRVALLGGRALLVTAAGRPAAVTVVAVGHELRLGIAAEVELDAREDDLRLAVLTGAAELRPVGLPGRRLTGGSGVVLPAAGGIAPMTAAGLAEAGAWRRGQLVYHDRALRDVLADLERYRGGRILALGEGLAAERVTGAFGLSDPDAALEAIAATLGVSLTRMPLLAVVRRA